MSPTDAVLQKLPLSERAHLALARAFARAVAEHQQNGLPLVLWRDGKVVKVPAEELTETAQTAGAVFAS